MVTLKCPIRYKASDSQYGKCEQFVELLFFPKHHKEGMQ
jgi:hypothetical protein